MTGFTPYESVGKKLLRVLRASAVHLFPGNFNTETRRHGDHGVYTEESNFPDKLSRGEDQDDASSSSINISETQEFFNS